MVLSAGPLPTLTYGDLRPFASFGVLEYVGADQSKAVGQMIDRLLNACLKRRGASAHLIGRGLAEGWRGGLNREMSQSLDADAFVVRRTRSASWAAPASQFTETLFDLVIVLRHDNLVAVACPPDRVDTLQSWLDDAGKSSFRRIDPLVLEHALLAGETRGLWLRGVHARQRRKPDAKNLVGLDVREALDPLGDGSFALTAGRAAVPDDPRLVHTSGTVGTTPKTSWVWNRRTARFDEFVGIAVEVMDLVRGEMGKAHGSSAFPDLATSIGSLDMVSGAFDAYFADPEDAATLPGTHDELIANAEKLRGCVIQVTPGQKANLTLTVGDDGAECGRLRCSPRLNDGHVSWDFRIDGTPSDPDRTAEIRNAAEASQLLNVFYESGHSINFDSIYERRTTHARFGNWRFEDFSGFDVASEKPAGATAEEIHNAIGQVGDTSLFAWVLANYPDGHLTCDDGSNEVADFVHIASDGTLTLIHVKSASSSSPGRECATGAFELVSGQAQKNARYLNVDELAARLKTPPISSPATWHDGARVGSRTALIAALEARSPTAEARVVIVQPHLHKAAHDRAMRQIEKRALKQEGRRLQLIETLFNSARGAITSQGADLQVVVSR